MINPTLTVKKYSNDYGMGFWEVQVFDLKKPMLRNNLSGCDNALMGYCIPKNQLNLSKSC